MTREEETVKSALLALCLLLVATPALAEKVTWTIPVPGIESFETLAKARSIVTRVRGVFIVSANMDTHTLTVTFEDTSTSLAEIREALAFEGFLSPAEGARQAEGH